MFVSVRLSASPALDLVTSSLSKTRKELHSFGSFQTSAWLAIGAFSFSIEIGFFLFLYEEYFQVFRFHKMEMFELDMTPTLSSTVVKANLSNFVNEARTLTDELHHQILKQQAVNDDFDSEVSLLFSEIIVEYW